MINLKGILGAVSAGIGNDYLIGAFLGKLIAYLVLNLGVVEIYLDGCFLGKIREDNRILCTTFLVYAGDGESGSSSINGYLEGLRYAVCNNAYLIGSAFGENESTSVEGNIYTVNGSLFEAGDEVDLALKLL